MWKWNAIMDVLAFRILTPDFRVPNSAFDLPQRLQRFQAHGVQRGNQTAKLAHGEGEEHADAQGVGVDDQLEHNELAAGVSAADDAAGGPAVCHGAQGATENAPQQ